jgi:hypothetical protein
MTPSLSHAEGSSHFHQLQTKRCVYLCVRIRCLSVPSACARGYIDLVVLQDLERDVLEIQIFQNDVAQVCATWHLLYTANQ